jgi:putative peptidoglycan lipid II flippase
LNAARSDHAPVMFTLIIDTMVVRTFSYNLASQTVEGALGIMNWATTLIQFPQGLVATAISIAILPTLSRQSVLIAMEATPETTADDAAAGIMVRERNRQTFRDTLGAGIRLAISLMLPASAALFALAVPIVALLFEHGQFTPADTAMTATALRWYLFGLPFAAVDLLLVYAFYARQDTLTPALIGLASFGVYLVAAVLLLPRFGLYSLMIADSLKHITHAVISAWLLARRMGGFGAQGFGRAVARNGLASLAMAAAGALAIAPLQAVFGLRVGQGNPWFQELLLVAGTVGVSVLVYALFAWLLRIEEWRSIWALLRRRLRG